MLSLLLFLFFPHHVSLVKIEMEIFAFPPPQKTRHVRRTRGEAAALPGSIIDAVNHQQGDSSSGEKKKSLIGKWGRSRFPWPSLSLSLAMRHGIPVLGLTLKWSQKKKKKEKDRFATLALFWWTAKDPLLIIGRTQIAVALYPIE